ncbi:MAG: dockerin type I repeat-containing protein, partial [Clostridia bacterium]|nr:dockerin type I repeat-containing protein [Clostridia bacterium]
VDGFTIRGFEDSADQTYAQENDFAFDIYVESECIIGDVDLDGSVSAADALEVLKSVVGKATLTEEQTKAADVDGNGKADAADALDILKKVVGKIDKFPVEQ